MHSSHVDSPVFSITEIPFMYEDQSEVFAADGTELPSNLGETVVKLMATAYLDDTIKERFVMWCDVM